MENRINNYPKPDTYMGCNSKNKKGLQSDSWFKCAPTGLKEYTVKVKIENMISSAEIAIKVVAKSKAEAEKRAIAVGKTIKHTYRVDVPEGKGKA